MNETQRIAELESQLAAILLERDGHRGYAETVRHLREDVRNLREENDGLRKEFAKLEHPLILAEGGTSDADRAIRVINKLTAAQWYWDDRDLDSATKSIGTATECDDHGDIIELRPLHELPTIYVLVVDKGYQVFESRQAAEALTPPDGTEGGE